MATALAIVVVVAATAPLASHAAHPVFDLVANRTLAHGVRGGGLAIAAGSPGFARYLHFSRPLPTWKLRLVEDGKKVAVASTSSVLEVPLTRFVDGDALRNDRWVRERNGAQIEVDVPYFEIEGEKVWGATAMVLAEFLEIVGRIGVLDSAMS